MSRRGKTKGGADWLVIGVAFVALAGGCAKTDAPRPTGGGMISVLEEEEAAEPTLYTRDGGMISNVNVWHPRQAILTEPMALTILGQGNSKWTEGCPAGTVVAVLGVDKELLFVEFRGVTQKIPAAGTDFAAQMAAVVTSP